MVKRRDVRLRTRRRFDLVDKRQRGHAIQRVVNAQRVAGDISGDARDVVTMTVNQQMARSRKFRMAVIDAAFSILLMWVAHLVRDPALLELTQATILALQAPFVAYIVGVAVEDSAKAKSNDTAANN